MRKTLFVTVFHSFVSKNILNTDALIQLRNSDEYLLVLLVPSHKKDFFETYYAHKNVVIEGIEMNSFVESGKESFCHHVSRLLIDTHYLHYKRKELLFQNKKKVQYFIREIIVFLFSKNKVAKRLFRIVDKFLAPRNIFNQLLERYKPDLIFSTDLFEQMSNQLVREAKYRTIPTIGMVRSWDNCLSKGLLRVFPDKVMVNNEVIRDELAALHDFPEDKIEVVGLPQFDSFVKGSGVDRATFFRKHGLDPQKRLIMFAPAGNVLSDRDGDICDMLVRARADGRIPGDIQFFIRNHPQHPADLFRFEQTGEVIVQSPGTILDKKTHKETELTPDDQEFLRDILSHTDLLIWVATSLCLDALVFDIPEIVINFDGYSQKDYYHSVKRYHDEDHMKKMFALKPFRVANSEDELLEYIRMYLNDKTIDAKERADARLQQLYRLDGEAGKRIAQTLSGFISEKGGAA